MEESGSTRTLASTPTVGQKLAEAAKELGIIRSMTTKEGEHGRATQLLHTGQLPSEVVAYPVEGRYGGRQVLVDCAFYVALEDQRHDRVPHLHIGGPVGFELVGGSCFRMRTIEQLMLSQQLRDPH